MDTAGTSFVYADKEMLDGLFKNDPIISGKIYAAAVNNKQTRVEVAQPYNQSVNYGNSGISFETYLNIQPLTRMLRESFRPLKPISEEISRRLRAGTDQDVEMDDMVEERSIVKKDDVKMDATDNVIVLD
ncbi:unnamed protein product [Arabidopsis halleri]